MSDTQQNTEKYLNIDVLGIYDGPRYNVPNPDTRFKETTQKDLMDAITRTSIRSTKQVEALKQILNR